MPDDSQELLARFQHGDATAADAIFARYTSRLLALARSRLSPKLARRIDADDVVQSTYRSFFIRARQGEFVAEHEGDLWRLLATITLHKVGRQAEHHNAAKRSLEREIASPIDERSCLTELADREPSAADVVAAAEELHWLMRQFEPCAREALQLRLQQLTAEEIATQLDRSERTIRRWLVEARELLMARWADQQRGPLDVDQGQRSSAFARSAANCVAAPLRHTNYRLERLIGSGGMAKVYVARQLDANRRVAIKVLRKRLRSRPHLVERFVREAQLVSRLDHPNIVPVHGLGQMPDGNYFLVLSFVEGEDLAALCRAAPLPAQRAAEIVASVADAIQHAHLRGVIHRDLKPGNVLIDRGGRVFVTDFGFAWFDGDVDRHDQSIVGTIGFMAPEQIDLSFGPIGPHTDVYGLGALLWIVVVGHRPPSGETVSQILDQASVPVDQRVFDAASERLPRGLQEICRRCLEPDWRRRIATAAEVAAALRSWLAGKQRVRLRVEE